MAKLIGTNPNQVPSNADLGTAAFQDVTDFLTARGSNLSAINSIITSSAFDVFVYDTSKDSDGGAWRKRTQHLSWYNEPLNTRVRGSRREFPAVAVIVVETNKVTIYDADDSTLPMWMYFDRKDGGSDVTYIGSDNTGNLTSVHALDGKMAVGVTVYGLFLTDFLKDKCNRYNTSTLELSENVAGRNMPSSLRNLGSGIINATINDVVMTALPNSPIDATTGLPVPTIAVATNAGISVIKDDGQIYDASDTANACGSVAFVDDRIVSDRTSAGGTRYFISQVISSINGDGWNPYEYYTGDFSAGFPLLRNDNGGGKISKAHGHSVRSSDVGLTFWNWKESDNVASLGDYYNNSPMAFVTSDYNTGWMQGDIRLATLSDTNPKDLIGTELVTNGTFDTNSSGWSLTTGSTISVSGGVATVTSSGTQIWAGAYQGISGLTPGKRYIATADIITSNNWGSFSFSNGAASALKYGVYTSWNGGSTFPIKARAEFTATTSSVVLNIDSLNTTSSTVTQIDNIVMREAVEDRSVPWNRGLQVFGNIKKTPVRAGADLVSYSGFNASGNYLKQPYNSNFNFGTNDFSISAWVKLPTINNPTRGIICEREGSGGFSWQFFQYNSRFYLYVGSTSSPAYTGQNYGDYDKWYHVVTGVKDGQIFIYVNGEYDVAVRGTPSSVTVTDAVMTVGVQTNTTSEPFTGGEIALLKVSGSVPSPEQIRSTYEDEKVLFQENAKATLYGTSDAVTGLAYDEATKLLHAGTSAGRSVFQGLRRIDNTTDAVGVAISASNGLVADE